ncbi:hypothetical protein [Gemmatimonas sp.]|uniref:hypothetical protein n=1 Tax=Gemmatimonas sp. TaxID=1962908 RepID=UPI0031BEE3FF|nr:hypothetical protein [Gemmatimonas sp.]
MTETIPGYRLEAPSRAMVLASLARYVDDEDVEELWRSACIAAGYDATMAPSPEELLPVLDALERLNELAAVCAKGLRIRIMSYVVLARVAKQQTGVPAAH